MASRGREGAASFSVVVPKGAAPGSSFQHTTDDGRELDLTVPEGVLPGDVLVLTQNPDTGGWSCVAQASGGPSAKSFSVSVPDWAGPGVSFQHRMPDGREMDIVVPPGVPAGSVLTLSQDPETGQWSCTAEATPSKPSAAAAPQSFSMVVPPDATPGTMLPFNLPDGRQLDIAVPPGVPPGSTLTLSQDPVTKAWSCEAELPKLPAAPARGAPPTASVVVPPDAVPGSMLSCTTPDGRQLDIAVPEGVPPGWVLTLTKDEATGSWKCEAAPPTADGATAEAPTRASEPLSFTVVVPPDAQPGSFLPCRTPDGKELDLAVPAGVPGGSTLRLTQDPATLAWGCTIESYGDAVPEAASPKAASPQVASSSPFPTDEAAPSPVASPGAAAPPAAVPDADASPSRSGSAARSPSPVIQLLHPPASGVVRAASGGSPWSGASAGGPSPLGPPAALGPLSSASSPISPGASAQATGGAEDFDRVSIVVPPSATPGTVLEQIMPDGQELSLRVPEGVYPGSVLTLVWDPTTGSWSCTADPAPVSPQESSAVDSPVPVFDASQASPQNHTGAFRHGVDAAAAGGQDFGPNSRFFFPGDMSTPGPDLPTALHVGAEAAPIGTFLDSVPGHASSAEAALPQRDSGDLEDVPEDPRPQLPWAGVAQRPSLEPPRDFSGGDRGRPELATIDERPPSPPRPSEEMSSPSRDRKAAPTSQVTVWYCDRHNASEKRAKSERGRVWECKGCKVEVNTNYKEFSYCQPCSQRERRCMVCGEGASSCSQMLVKPREQEERKPAPQHGLQASNVPPRYCQNHAQSEQRVKVTNPKFWDCASCGRQVTTNYAAFKLCPPCSEREMRCMICGEQALQAGKYVPPASLHNGGATAAPSPDAPAPTRDSQPGEQPQPWQPPHAAEQAQQWNAMAPAAPNAWEQPPQQVLSYVPPPEASPAASVSGPSWTPLPQVDQNSSFTPLPDLASSAEDVMTQMPTMPMVLQQHSMAMGVTAASSVAPVQQPQWGRPMAAGYQPAAFGGLPTVPHYPPPGHLQEAMPGMHRQPGAASVAGATALPPGHLQVAQGCSISSRPDHLGVRPPMGAVPQHQQPGLQHQFMLGQQAHMVPGMGMQRPGWPPKGMNPSGLQQHVPTPLSRGPF